MAVSEVRRGKALAVVLESAVITDTEGNAIDLSELNPQQPDIEAIIAAAQAEAEAAAAAEAIAEEEVVDEAVEITEEAVTKPPRLRPRPTTRSPQVDRACPGGRPTRWVPGELSRLRNRVGPGNRDRGRSR